MAEIVNIVAGGELGNEVDLKTVQTELSEHKSVSAKFSGDGYWQLILSFDDSGTLILYRTGKYIIRAGSSFEGLNMMYEELIKLFGNTSIIDEDGGSYQIQNIVFLEEFDLSVNLSEVAIRLGMENVEYEPEQFPGLIYRPPNFELVMLVFSTGKIIITGTTIEEKVEEAVSNLQKILIEVSNG
jgi:transcription initiation factor TFIID TATA-box-binding protein